MQNSGWVRTVETVLLAEVRVQFATAVLGSYLTCIGYPDTQGNLADIIIYNKLLNIECIMIFCTVRNLFEA